MTHLDWKTLLAAWSRDLMNTDLVQRLDRPGPEHPPGHAPASEVELAKLEERLGVRLPPSYRSFLAVSNGWGWTGPFVSRLRPAPEANWFRVENEHWVEAYAGVGSDLPNKKYYTYTEDGAHDHRSKHMALLLQVSDVDDGVYLLNPRAVTADGEWEAWFFANWIPGACRYPSFSHLMVHEYKSLVTLHGLERLSYEPPNLLIPPPDAARKPAKIARKKASAAPPLDELIDGLRLADAKLRGKAVRTFFGKLRGRPGATRRPDLVAPLTELFYASADPAVRSACVAGLTELAEDGDAPRPLFEALSDPDPGVILQGMFALHYFPDARAVEPLCRFIASRVNALFNETAMTHLGQMGDERAVPTLASVLLEPTTPFEQSIGTAGQALAQCGPRGVDVLLAAAAHDDARVRRAAAVGLDLCGDPRAEASLDKLAQDEDERVRSRAGQRVGEHYRWLMGKGSMS